MIRVYAVVRFPYAVFLSLISYVLTRAAQYNTCVFHKVNVSHMSKRISNCKNIGNEFTVVFRCTIKARLISLATHNN